ncbi:MAG: tRNA (N6-isopentenyl adenosine(37)-C2)-methylthiotransferase MiaB [bacterium]
MRYHLKTYGCQMNSHDSEYLAGVLEAFGWLPSPEEEADFVVLNTCSVRDNAEQKARSLLGKLRRRKLSQPALAVAVLGCMGERARHQLEKQPEIDLTLGPRQLEEFPDRLRRLHLERGWPLPVEEEPGTIPYRRARGVSASVNITLGCNSFCSYCVVPLVRGREASRPPEEVSREVTEAVSCGFPEVLLLGQNVNSYGREWNGWDLARLLQLLHPTAGLVRIRTMTSHPRDFSHSLVERIAELPKVCEHFHLPLQSGSDRLLQAMNRGYSRAQYLSLVQAIRGRFPRASITTDLIVGYPLEEEADFLDTLQLMEEVRFDNAHILAYSPRPGTAAFPLGDPIPKGEKGRRLSLLMEAHQIHALERNRELVGETVEVLVEERDPRSGKMYGRTGSDKAVYFPGEEAWIGSLRMVRVETAAAWSLLGVV